MAKQQTENKTFEQTEWPKPEQLGLLLEGQHPDTIFLYGSYASGRVEYISPSVEEILGYPYEEVLHGGIEFWPQRTHPEDLPETLAQFVSAFKEGQEVDFDPRKMVSCPIYYRFLHGNGSWVWMVNMNLILTYNAKRQPDMVFSTMRIYPQKEKPVVFPKREKYDPEMLEVTLRQEVLRNISPRERDVLKHIADGRSTKEIAEQLHISEHTVNSHRKSLMAKFEVKNTAELIKEASKVFWLE